MIFTGIEILFFSLGVLSTLAIGLIYYYNQKLKFSVPAWTTSILGAFLFIFGIAWAFSSVLEGEPRAASMGLIVFVIPSLILLLFSRKLAIRKSTGK
ncbi:hypothetical protein [Marinifilum caeruleilacunae]|uniref:Dehalogenase n=1 Tax=Marinifilum caeruleilacunae TaxID=2499076 RepID=A0ABX1WQY8_9BACT|nr:hypothetical protein [Marinifilum caeruleilacunae]NOU58473.1 hypothetical protein [Marinifilum caeruleilacunae]